MGKNMGVGTHLILDDISHTIFTQEAPLAVPTRGSIGVRTHLDASQTWGDRAMERYLYGLDFGKISQLDCIIKLF